MKNWMKNSQKARCCTILRSTLNEMKSLNFLRVFRNRKTNVKVRNFDTIAKFVFHTLWFTHYTDFMMMQYFVHFYFPFSVSWIVDKMGCFRLWLEKSLYLLLNSLKWTSTWYVYNICLIYAHLYFKLPLWCTKIQRTYYGERDWEMF